MAWPKLDNVACYGFPKSWLPAIKHAVDTKNVKWGKDSLFASSGNAEFEWADCTWELSENFELVNSVSLLSGHPKSEDLTAAVLKSKI